jgi:periplasmic divalent cation tolerance protein
MASIVVVTTTLPIEWTMQQITELKTKLISQQLAACVQSEKINSTYSWEGEIVSEDEWRLTIKTTINRQESVISTLIENHPYDVPQIVHRIEQSSSEYSDWVKQQVGG